MELTPQDDVTLGDVIRLALPFGTMVSTGPGQTHRPVDWLASLASLEELEQEVQPRDLALMPSVLLQGRETETLVGLVEQLAAIPAAALVTFTDLPPQVKRAAVRSNFPILVLPADAALRRVQRMVTSLLLDRQTQTTERGLELYRRLSEMSLEEQGLQAMTEMMATVTGKVVVVQDKRLDVRALARHTKKGGLSR